MHSSHLSNSTSPSPQIIRILWRQQQELLKKSPDCVSPIINNEDPLDIQADISGPKGTPYEDGIFRVKLYIPPEFPQVAPKGYFMTKIYHPNVSEKGEICVNTLKKDWNPKQWSLYNLLEVIKCLLIIPFPESSLNEEAGKIFMENYEEYFKIAKIYTNVHAGKSKKVNDEDNNKNDNTKSNCNTNVNNNEQINKGNNKIEDENSKFTLIGRSRTINQTIDGNLQNFSSGVINNNINNNYNLFGPFNRGNSNIISNTTFGFGDLTNMVNNGCYHPPNNQVELHSSEEKPKLGSLPFIRSNSVRMNNNNISNNNVQSFPLRGNSGLNVMGELKKNDQDEINKWLMRI